MRPPVRLAILTLLVMGTQGLSCPFRGDRSPDPTAQRARAAEQEIELRQMLTRDPNNPQTTRALANVLAFQMKTREAVEYFDRTLALDPPQASDVQKDRRRHLHASHKQAEGFLDVGDMEAAERMLGHAEILMPLNSHTFYLRGQVTRHREGWPAAVPLFRKALEGHVTNRDYREALGRALFVKGEEHYNREEFEAAFRALSEVDYLQPGSDLDFLLGLTAYGWARQDDTRRDEHLESAAYFFREVLKKDPEDEEAAFKLAAVYLSGEHYVRAAEVYRDMQERDPTDGRFLLALARIHIMAGKNDLAAAEDAAGRALVQGDPVDNPRIWAHRAADRFPDSDLSSLYREVGLPEAVYTYSSPAGSLVEVWCYWEKNMIEAFQDGARIGVPIRLP